MRLKNINFISAGTKVCDLTLYHMATGRKVNTRMESEGEIELGRTGEGPEETNPGARSQTGGGADKI